jgi:hypothetical protein
MNRMVHAQNTYAAMQVGNLRYGRLAICVTGQGEMRLVEGRPG